MNLISQLLYIWTLPKKYASTHKIKSTIIRGGTYTFDIEVTFQHNFLGDVTSTEFVTFCICASETMILQAIEAIKFLQTKPHSKQSSDHMRDMQVLIQAITEFVEDFVLDPNRPPNDQRLMDLNFQVTKKLIKSECNDIIEKMLQDVESRGRNRHLHLPYIYKRRKHFGRQQKISTLSVETKERNIYVVKLLLEYYCKCENHNLGWMSTVTDCLPDLYAHPSWYV